jgi:hypothetical protein
MITSLVAVAAGLVVVAVAELNWQRAISAAAAAGLVACSDRDVTSVP